MQFCWQVKWMNCINPKKINLISSRKHMSGPKPVPVTRNNSWSSRDFKFDPRKEGLQLLTWSLHCLPWDISELTSHSQHQLIVFFFFFYRTLWSFLFKDFHGSEEHLSKILQLATLHFNCLPYFCAKLLKVYVYLKVLWIPLNSGIVNGTTVKLGDNLHGFSDVSLLMWRMSMGSTLSLPPIPIFLSCKK